MVEHSSRPSFLGEKVVVRKCPGSESVSCSGVEKVVQRLLWLVIWARQSYHTMGVLTTTSSHFAKRLFQKIYESQKLREFAKYVFVTNVQSCYLILGSVSMDYVIRDSCREDGFTKKFATVKHVLLGKFKNIFFCKI